MIAENSAPEKQEEMTWLQNNANYSWIWSQPLQFTALITSIMNSDNDAVIKTGDKATLGLIYR